MGRQIPRKEVLLYATVLKFVRKNRGAEMTETAGLIAVFVVIVLGAFGYFGGVLSNFVHGLPGLLGM